MSYLTALRNKTIRFKSKKEPLNKRISLKQGYPAIVYRYKLDTKQKNVETKNRRVSRTVPSDDRSP